MRSSRSPRRCFFALATGLLVAAAACNAVIGLRDYVDVAPDGAIEQMDSTLGSDGSSAPSADGDSPGTNDGGLLVFSGDSAIVIGDVDASFPDVGDAAVFDASCDAGSYCALVQADNPLAYFRFDDLAVDGSTTPLDWSGHGVEMAFFGAVHFSLGTALNESRGCLRMGDANDTRVGGGYKLYSHDGDGGPYVSGTTPFSIDLFIHQSLQVGDAQGLLTTVQEMPVDGVSSYSGFQFVVEPASSALVDASVPVGFQICLDSPTCAGVYSGTTLGRSEWQHVAAVYDPSPDGVSTVFVDGVAGPPVHLSLDGGLPLFGPTTNLLDLYLDELAIYPVALDGGTIKAHAAFLVP